MTKLVNPTTSQNYNFVDRLLKRKKIIDQAVKKTLGNYTSSTASVYGQYSDLAMASYSSVASRGGKRLRGSLVIESYLLHGGADELLALDLAVAIEMVHAYLLVVDDFCDKSETRRGKLTANKEIELYHKAKTFRGDSEHFGNSIAVNAALVAMQYTTDLILNMNLPDEVKIILLKQLGQSLIITGHGQINDIFNEALPVVEESMIYKVLEWKTGHYTFYNPIEMGAILAGKKINGDGQLKNYSSCLGKAFQLQDDIIGIFGDDIITGKSNLDDIKEGKMTLLYKKAIELSDAKDKLVLISCLGNEDADNKDLKNIRNIMYKNGALELAEKIVGDNISKAIVSISELKTDRQDSKQFMIDLAHFIRKRKS